MFRISSTDINHTTLFFCALAVVAAPMVLHGLYRGVSVPLADLPAFQAAGAELAELVRDSADDARDPLVVEAETVCLCKADDPPGTLPP